MIKWSETAEKDILEIAKYLRASLVENADEIVGAIISSVERLENFKLSGRKGQIPDTYEVVMTKYPYTIPYTIINGTVIILRVLHQRQKLGGLV